VIREQRGNWHADFLGVFNHTALSAFQAGLAVVSSRTMAHCARIKVGTSITATPPLSAHPQIPELADQSPLRDSAGVNRPRENSAGRVLQYLPREGLEQAPVASIGGAGTYDGIFLTGILAVLLARF
jgi:hypothetical protein